MSGGERTIIGAFSPSMIDDLMARNGVTVKIQLHSLEEGCEKIKNAKNPIVTLRHLGTAKAISDLCGKNIQPEGKNVNDAKPGDEIIALLLNTRPEGDKTNVKPDELKIYSIKILGQA